MAFTPELCVGEELVMSTSCRRVAFLMLTYNQGTLVRASAEACLSQQCEPLDIIFSDDASSDDTFEVLQDVVRNYEGPHHVIVRRNEKNMGIGGHINALIASYPNEFYVASAGDDISMPDRAKALIQVWDDSQQKLDLISSHCIQMSYDGRPGDVIRTDMLNGLTPTDWMMRRPYVVGATHAFTRRLHLKFGPFVPGVVGEDQVMVFRALCAGGAATLDQAYVYYRDGGISRKPEQMSSAEHLAWIRKKNLADMAEMVQIIKDAELAGFGADADRIFSEKLERARFLSAVLDERRFVQMCRVARRYPSVPFWWRFKKVVTTRFYAPYHAIHRFNLKRRDWARTLKNR